VTAATFIVSKHPFGPVEDGETRITRRLLDAAAASCRVRVVALTEPAGVRGGPVEVVEVPKPALRPARLALAGAARRRSLIHARFAPAALVRALSEEPARVLVARRVYMAQAALDAGRGAPADRLVALVDVLESRVMTMRRSPLAPLLALEARRTRRDERRCVQGASEVAFLSDTEARALEGVAAGRRLDLALPPAPEPAALDEPLAVFVGDRRWVPNADALARLLGLWPRIARGASRARLLVVGHPARRERIPNDPSIEAPGFVEDLDALWRSVAVLLAPVSIGGGVRVKVLDAARHGVPVVGSPDAIGATGDYLPIATRASDDEFVEDAVGLLADARRRRDEGHSLFEANRSLHERGFVEEQVARLLVGAPAPGPATRASA
jgi:hypothetical protein